MLQYVMSDIHGNLPAFLKLIDYIDFKTDRLIILGDIIDKCKDRYSIDTIQFIRKLMRDHPGHIIVTMGNHEKYFVDYVEGRLPEATWSSNMYGGASTLATMKKMTMAEINELKAFFLELPLYYEVTSPVFGPTICTHTGVHGDYLEYNPDGTINVIKSIEKGFREADINYLSFGDIHNISLSKNKPSHYMIVGHIPCVFLEEKSYKILKRKYFMCIDSGSEENCKKLGGRLSMYCIETDQEYYS